MAKPDYASEIQSEALKAIGARYRRDIRLMLYAGLAIALLLLALLGMSLNQEDKLSQELDAQHQLITNGQAHTRQVLSSQANQTSVVEADIQCIATLFASRTPGSVTVTDLQTCQIEPTTNANSGSAAPDPATQPTLNPTPAPTQKSSQNSNSQGNNQGGNSQGDVQPKSLTQHIMDFLTNLF